MAYCQNCNRQLNIGEWPFCPHGYTGRFGAQGDEVDYWVENLGPEPVHIRSKIQHEKLMKERGLKRFVRHVPHPRGPKYDHTVDWSLVVTDKEMQDRKELLERAFRQKSRPQEPERPLIRLESGEMSGEEAMKYAEGV